MQFKKTDKLLLKSDPVQVPKEVHDKAGPQRLPCPILCKSKTAISISRDHITRCASHVALNSIISGARVKRCLFPGNGDTAVELVPFHIPNEHL